MNILFVNPPWWVSQTPIELTIQEEHSLTHTGVRCGSRWPFTLHGQSTPNRFIFGSYLPYPFFMGYAATYVQKTLGVPVTMRDSLAIKESYHAFFGFLAKNRFTHLVMESATPSWEHDKRLLRAIAQRHPELHLIITGPIATKGETILTETPAHTVIKGEYEKGCVKAITQNIHGVIDFDLLTKEEMNAAPFPYYDALLAHRYCDTNPRGQKFPHAQVWSSRGCPYKCIFCVWPATMTGNDPDGKGRRSVRQYSKEYMEAFLTELVARYHFQSIYFDDDTFNLGDKHVLAMCEVMGRLGLPWSAMCRPDTIQMSTWNAMKESGCFGVKLGVESGNQVVVDTIVNKRMDLHHTQKVVHHLKSIGISVHGTFTIGLPGETKEQQNDTWRFIHSLPFDSIQTSGCAEIEGTPLHTLAQTGTLAAYSGAKLDEGYQRHADGAVKMAAISTNSNQETQLMPSTQAPQAPLLDTILALDDNNDLHGLLSFIQSQTFDQNALHFSLYSLLHKLRIRPAYILSSFIHQLGHSNPLILLGMAAGATLFDQFTQHAAILQQLSHHVETEYQQQEQQELLHQVTIPILTYFLTIAKTTDNQALLQRTLLFVCAIIPAFCQKTQETPQIPQTPSPASDKIHVIDHLFSFYGHHVAVDNAIRSFCQQQNMAIQFYIQHLPTHPFTLPEDMIPIFWGVESDSTLGGKRNQLFYENLMHHLHPQPQDRIIIHTLYDNILIGLYQWLVALPHLPQQVRILLRFPPNLKLTNQILPYWMEPLFALGLKLLDTLKPQVRFFVDSQNLFNYFHDMAGIRPAILPISIDFSPLPSLASQPIPKQSSKTKVLFLGESRGEKGFVLLPTAIRIVRLVTQDIEFDIHLTNTNPRDQPYLDDLRTMTDGVYLTENVRLYGEDYFAKILSVDAVLIPYSPLSYTYRTSHIMVESLGSGRPVIATGENSWMEGFLHPLYPKPGVIMSEFSSFALATAILEFHKHKIQYQQAAQTIAPRIQAEHNLTRFMTKLLTDQA